MATRSEALRGNQNAAGPRGVKGIAAKVSEDVKKNYGLAKAGLSSAATSARSSLSSAVGSAKASIAKATPGAVGSMKSGLAKMKTAAAGGTALAATKLKAGVLTVKNATPAAKKDRARVDANKSAFIRSERVAQQVAATPKGRIKAAALDASIAVKRAGNAVNKAVTSPKAMEAGDAIKGSVSRKVDAVKKSASTVASGFDDTYGKRARQAGGAVKRFVKKTYTSGG